MNLENISLFKDADIKKYESSIIIKEFIKDEAIFHENEKCNRLGVILSGQIKISTYTYIGNEYIIRILSEDEIFGQNLLFEQEKKYLGTACALTNTKIAFISKELLLILLKNEKILMNYLMVLSSHTTIINQRLKLFSQKTIEDRILFYLTNEAKKLNSNVIPIKSKENLAIILNIPRPSLSRELINLKRKNLIDYDKHQILLKK